MPQTDPEILTGAAALNDAETKANAIAFAAETAARLRYMDADDADELSVFQHNFTIWMMRNHAGLVRGEDINPSDPPPRPPEVLLKFHGFLKV